MIGLGTIVNTAAVVAGGLLGLLLKNGIAKRFEKILMQTLGLATIFIGAGGVLQYMLVVKVGVLSTQGTMLLIFSLVIGCSRAAAPVCGFSRGTAARSVSLSWGAREVGSPCEWRGGARHCSRAMVGESGLETC